MTTVEKKPYWLKVKAPTSIGTKKTQNIVDAQNLVTVCEEANCPNKEECWKSGTATFMLMGDTCTRACRFCSVKTGRPSLPPDQEEPHKVALAIKKMNLSYVVLTSVDRDDLTDFGASHLATAIAMIKKEMPSTIVEILSPDLGGDKKHLTTLLNAKPAVFAHNLETVEDLTPEVRDRRSTYQNSLNVLKMAKEISPDIFTKTSLMLGLGENRYQIQKTLEDLRNVQCDVVTFGQYLSPTYRHERHLPVVEYIHPDTFRIWKEIALEMGFLFVASGPLVRSSYKASELFLEKTIKNKYLNTQFIGDSFFV